MSRKFIYLGLAIAGLFASGLIWEGCSGGSNSPTEPEAPSVASASQTADTSEVVEQIVGPGVSIEKATQGFDADTPPGPSIGVDRPVEWTYVVTNIGDVTLQSWVVTDDKLDPEEVCRGSDLAPGASFTCPATGTAEAGQYTNTGTVGASDGNTRVTDSDPSHYLGGGGAFSAIQIEKSTNGEDADYPTGPIVLARQTPITWTYEIENIGQVELGPWQVTDDQLSGIVVCDGESLGVGESDSCSYGPVRAVAGQYSNVGLVRAFDGTTRISDEDPSNYFGSDPAISVDKLTDGEDGPQLVIGCPVTWTYEVTNEGNIDLDNIVLMDDKVGQIRCPTSLPEGESTTCTATGTVGRDRYNNKATVTATDPIDTGVEATDTSSYTVTNDPVECDQAVASPVELWPPNHQLIDVNIVIIDDVCERPLTVEFTGVMQDEPLNGTGDGDTSPDAIGVGTQSLQLRSERQGGGDGRVYLVEFTVTDPGGGSCDGTVTVMVPHDQSGDLAQDSGPPYYDSTTSD